MDRLKVGRRLITFAWGVEVLAAIVGLMIAVLVILTTAEEISRAGLSMGPSSYLDMFLGGLPFVVVAMVELTKIPLATACFITTSAPWRMAFGFGLLLLSIITFETILNGFERNFTARTSVISHAKKLLQLTDDQIRQVGAEIADLSSTTDDQLRANLQADLEQIEREKNAALGDVDKQRDEALRQYGGEEARTKQEQIGRIDEDIRQIEARQTAELTRINDRYGIEIQRTDTSVIDRRKILTTEIDRLEKGLESSRQAEQAELNRVKDSADPTGEVRELERIEKDFQQRTTQARDAIDTQRKSIQDQLTATNQLIAAKESDRERQLQAASFFSQIK